MKRFINIFAVMSVAVAFSMLLGVNVSAQILLNEVESDPPVDVNDSCQYVEILGTPGGTVPANTYFVSINSDQDNFGFLNVAVDISGQNFGANGTITLVNTLQITCPNRTYDAGTTIVGYGSLLTLGKDSEGFYVINSGGASLFSGMDLDADDNGTIDAGGSLGGISFIDGFSYIFNPDEQYAYGPGPNLVETLLGDVPDAATRFPGNSDANSAAAWYSGEVSDAAEESVEYTSPVSSNFPAGGVLTPGAPNAAAPGNQARFDYDGDGKTDISVFRPSTSPAQWWYLRSSDGGNRAFSFGSSTDTPAPADFTGDGKTDLAFWRDSTGEWYILRSEDSTFYAFPFGTSGDIPAPGDFDGDGTADAAVFRPSVATWFILNSGGGTTIESFGLSTDVPTVEDFDGDGMDDIAIYRPSLSQFWQLRSSAGLIAYTFGAAGDTAVPADYTGDGKADVAVWRDATGEWFVLRSEDATFYGFPFGTSGDLPVPGDYDGDGEADAAVFRPTNNTWYKQQTTSGFEQITFGLAGDIPTPGAFIP